MSDALTTEGRVVKKLVHKMCHIAIEAIQTYVLATTPGGVTRWQLNGHSLAYFFQVGTLTQQKRPAFLNVMAWKGNVMPSNLYFKDYFCKNVYGKKKPCQAFYS